VGSVVVNASGDTLGSGAHQGPGNPHAEVIALTAAAGSTNGAVLYVTLEPCTHQGRTPPCVDAIIAAGIATVVIAARDPDVRVAGSGVSKLREAGIEVVEDIMTGEAHEMDPAYFHHRTTGMPLVTMKYAMTLDGSVAAVDSTSKWITSEAAREDLHQLRAVMDGVVVGAGTLRVDDPALNVRTEEHTGSQPRPVLIAGATPLPVQARIWHRDPVVVATAPTDLPSGNLVVVSGEPGRPDPEAACLALADLGLLALLLEGGPKLAGAWWRSGVVDRGVVYVGARVGGGTGRSPLDGVFGTMADARVVTVESVRSLDGDLRIDFTPR
jgi:diaminohydroxyphosphoribosylaminopyrimidine deaminase/5-amino-6-(5-phosphoribosylamino)uracil reductase